MSRGVISAINGDEVTVRIRCSSACAECSQYHTCSLEKMTKEIKVKSDPTQHYTIGQEVTLNITQKNIFLCLTLAYLIPLMLLLSVIWGGTLAGWQEAISAVAALLSLIPYYAILFLMNSRLKKHLKITITENSVD